jgi:hypothetical protein
MSEEKNRTEEWNCPGCGKPLTGAIEIETRKSGDIGEIVFGETTDRNWIQCDGCNKTICKQCCEKPETGYCNDCLARQQTKSKTGRVVIIMFACSRKR